jgi:hypothetical protein
MGCFLMRMIMIAAMAVLLAACGDQDVVSRQVEPFGFHDVKFSSLRQVYVDGQRRICRGFTAKSTAGKEVSGAACASAGGNGFYLHLDA